MIKCLFKVVRRILALCLNLSFTYLVDIQPYELNLLWKTASLTEAQLQIRLLNIKKKKKKKKKNEKY